MPEEMRCEKCGRKKPQKSFEHKGRMVSVLWCSECRSEQSVEYEKVKDHLYYIKNRDQARAYGKQYRAEHFETCDISKLRKWAQENPEKVKEAEVRRRHTQKEQREASRQERLNAGDNPARVYVSLRKAANEVEVPYTTLRMYYEDGSISGRWDGGILFVSVIVLREELEERCRQRDITRSVQAYEQKMKSMKNRKAQEGYVSITQAAHALGMSRQRLHQHYVAGHITGTKEEGIVWVRVAQVREELKNYKGTRHVQ